MSVQFTFRTANLEDLNTLQNLFVNTITNVCNTDYSPEEIDRWTSSISRIDRWETAIREQYFLLAVINDDIVGFGTLRDNDYIDFLYIHHLHQGKGIAGALIKQLTDRAKSFNTHIIYSDVSITAKPFFLKQGFEVVRKNHHHFEAVTLINYHVKLEL